MEQTATAVTNNIDILDGFGLCDVPEVREELERRAKND